MKPVLWNYLCGWILLSLLASGCAAPPAAASPAAAEPVSVRQQALVEVDAQESALPEQAAFTPRPPYDPGQLVDYTAQTGDTLPALAARFNTSVNEILAANPFIPADATTMPPGMPMQIPIYYLPFWGTPYQIIPDSLFVNGPAAIGFNTEEFVASFPGWLNRYETYVSGSNRNGAQVVELIATNYSVSPRLLLALLEHQSGALTNPNPTPDQMSYPVGYVNRNQSGLFYQLSWAANTLNNGYYNWRTGRLTLLELLNGRIERPDPWQNAASVALHYFFSRLYAGDPFALAISPEGLARTYRELFGDPWQQVVEPHIPGSLVQPAFQLPFEPRKTWAYTGGPHTGWGQGEPLAAIDFAPPSVAGGCTDTNELSTAVAAGVVARSQTGLVILDLDGDGDERTGWSILYLHAATVGRAPKGAILQAGDPIGHPSCEGGRATGTHIHMARRYNGEWIPAAGVLPFNLEGWIPQNGIVEYQGTLTRYGQVIYACECSDATSHISSDLVR
jgi:LasA protease